jgi:hypothetical protein
MYSHQYCADVVGLCLRLLLTRTVQGVGDAAFELSTGSAYISICLPDLLRSKRTIAQKTLVVLGFVSGGIGNECDLIRYEDELRMVAHQILDEWIDSDA